MGARVVAVCTSAERGRKRAAERAEFVAGHGIAGDAHAGPTHRQISLLDERDVESMRAQGLSLEPGAFGENLVLAGLDLEALGAGSRLSVGAAEIELTQVGKVCHEPCSIYAQAGDCVMPRAGVFARVLRGGEVAPGDHVALVAVVPRSMIQAAVLTVSDRCAAGQTRDTAGPAVAAELEAALGARVARVVLVPDEADVIARELEQLAGQRLDLVLTAGGTGCGPRDVTPEATRRVIDRELPGLAEAMRAASARITPHALLQRGIAGTRHDTLIVNLPGSEQAALENLRAILPALPHAVRLLRGEAAHAEADRSRSA